MLAYDKRDDYEIIEGVKFMAASPFKRHGKVIGRLMFVSAANEKIVFDNEDETFYGVPDMVAKVFTRSTMKRDFTIKKDIYERNGVREYWLINPWSESIEVYLLGDGKCELDDVYPNYSDTVLNNLTDEERAEVKLKVKNIFGRYFE